MPYVSPSSKSTTLSCDSNQDTCGPASDQKQAQSHGKTPEDPNGPQVRDVDVARPHRISRRHAADDSALNSQYGRNIDYLDHDWSEEHLWWCWKYITTHRGYTPDENRLENIIWRAWAKCKNNLRTVSPSTINWLRDKDVGYLYGPFRPSTDLDRSEQTWTRALLPYSKPPTGSILKDRSRSDVFLQATRSSASLCRQATTATEAQRQDGWKPMTYLLDVPRLVNLDSMFPFPTREKAHNGKDPPHCEEYSSNAGKKRIHFCNEVEQRISVQGGGGSGGSGSNVGSITDDDNSPGGASLFLRLAKSLRLAMSGRRAAEHQWNTSSIPQATTATLPPKTLSL
ncbi:unnamed protein product [Clonostachys rosea f. rosea IK726]|uniref:Nitrogen regulatory protein areA GATA-like domain-containing protein n=2 Tax=Bionectria ochroleuca TaxID=29856 RepID=A0A0B7KRL7_BIOOC|nr:unnamed protein product [Clonostachys rosea f. rosea IK726]